MRDGGGARGGAIFADGGSLIVNTATFANNFALAVTRRWWADQRWP